MSCRHLRRRARRADLKADSVILLDRIAAAIGYTERTLPSDNLLLEIAEMRLRIAPPPGVKAPIVRTGYTRRKA